LEDGFNSHRPVQLIAGQIGTKDHVREADQPAMGTQLINPSAFIDTNQRAS